MLKYSPWLSHDQNTCEEVDHMLIWQCDMGILQLQLTGCWISSKHGLYASYFWNIFVFTEDM